MHGEAKTRWWGVVLLALVPSGLLLGALELGGRLAGFKPETWSALDDQLGYKMSPPSQGFPVLASSGARAERADLLLLGDSITYLGYPVAETKHSFADLLRTRGLEVVNLSGIGYGTDQELLLLERHVDELPQVDLVILNFCLLNDLIDNGNEVNPHDGFRPKPYFERVDGKLVRRDGHLRFGVLDRFSLYVRQRSGALFLIRLLLGMERPREQAAAERSPRRYRIRLTGGAPDEATYREYRERLLAGIPVTRALLERMERVASERLGARRFIVLLHPTTYKPAGASPWTLDPAVERLFQDIPGAVDLGCRYAARGLHYNQIAYDQVGHLTARGHAVVAEEIASLLAADPAQPLACHPGGPVRADGPTGDEAAADAPDETDSGGPGDAARRRSATAPAPRWTPPSRKPTLPARRDLTALQGQVLRSGGKTPEKNPDGNRNSASNPTFLLCREPDISIWG